MGGRLLRMGAGSLVVLKIGTAANLVRCLWLGHRDKPLKRNGFSRVSTYPACARLKFGGGRFREIRYGTDTQPGIARCPGEFTAFRLGAGIPSSSRKGALGGLCGR